MAKLNGSKQMSFEQALKIVNDWMNGLREYDYLTNLACKMLRGY